MRKFLLLLLLTLSFSGCAFSHTYVTVRNQTENSISVTVDYGSIGFELQPFEEIELFVNCKGLILKTDYGVVMVSVTEDTTIELHRNGYYLGEVFHKYITEPR